MAQCGQHHSEPSALVELYVNGKSIDACYENKEIYVHDDTSSGGGNVADFNRVVLWKNLDIKQSIPAMAGAKADELISEWGEGGKRIMVFNTAMEYSPIKITRKDEFVDIKIWLEFLGALKANVPEWQEDPVDPKNDIEVKGSRILLMQLVKDGIRQWEKTYPANGTWDTFGDDPEVTVVIDIKEGPANSQQRVLPVLLFARKAFNLVVNEDNQFYPYLNVATYQTELSKANDSANPNSSTGSLLQQLETAMANQDVKKVVKLEAIYRQKFPLAPKKSQQQNTGTAQQQNDWEWSIALEDCFIEFYEGRIKGNKNEEYKSHWFLDVVGHEIGHAFGLDHAYGEKGRADAAITMEISQNDVMRAMDEDRHFDPSSNDIEMILEAWKMNQMQYFDSFGTVKKSVKIII